MNKSFKHNRCRGFDSRGFSLIELLVVIAILGALAAAVGVYINTSDAKLRSFAFNMGSRFKQAKFEAIKNGLNAYLDFNVYASSGYTSGKGFTIWVDKDKDGTFDPGPPPTDEKIGEVVFPDGIEIYDPAGDTITGGPPDVDGGPDGVGDDIGNGINDADGDIMIKFSPGGASESARVYVYAAKINAGGKVDMAGPWAIDVNSVGRIRLAEWKNGKWQLD